MEATRPARRTSGCTGRERRPGQAPRPREARRAIRRPAAARSGERRRRPRRARTASAASGFTTTSARSTGSGRLGQARPARIAVDRPTPSGGPPSPGSPSSSTPNRRSDPKPLPVADAPTTAIVLSATNCRIDSPVTAILPPSARPPSLRPPSRVPRPYSHSNTIVTFTSGCRLWRTGQVSAARSSSTRSARLRHSAGRDRDGGASALRCAASAPPSSP